MTAQSHPSEVELLRTRRFTVVELHVQRPDGQPASCLAVRHPGAVVILPLLGDGRICLIRSQRMTVGRTLVELPAGTREPDEPPLETARRELEEETGYRAAHLEPLAEFFTSPGVLDERMDAFVATGLTPGPPRREANEHIENFVVTWDEAMEMVGRGEVMDAKSLVTLLLYERRGNAGGGTGIAAT
jgi:ADP-ribose pyrophosphatase